MRSRVGRLGSKVLASSLGILLAALGGLLWPAQPAYAHRPHDVVPYVEVSPSFSQDSTLYILGRNNLFRSTDQGNTWSRLSNGLDNRFDFSSLDLSPVDPALLYLTSPGDGIYTSKDGGDSWQTVNQGLDSLDITWIQASATSSQVALAMTQDNQLYQTSNGGNRWQKVLTASDATSLAYIPETPTALLGNAQGQLWRSDDQGTTWSAWSTLPQGEAIQAIAPSPNYSTDQTLFIATAESGIYQSIDGGASFTSLNQGLEDLRVREVLPLPAPAGEMSLLAITWDGGCWRWRPEQAQWVNTDTGLSRDPQADEMEVPHFQDLEISDRFQTDGIAFLGGFDGLFRSRDGGNTWTELETLSLGTIIDLTVSPTLAEDGTLAVATYVGELYISHDRGDSWQAINQDLYLPRFNRTLKTPGRYEQDPRRFFDIDISSNYAADETLFSAILYSKILQSSDGGQRWSIAQLDKSERGVTLAVSPNFAEDHTVFSTNQSGRVYRSQDRGHTFERIGESAKQPGNDSPSTVLSPGFAVDQTLFTTGEQGIYQSTDAGKTWTLLTADTPLAEATGLQLAISPNFPEDQTLLVATRSGLYQTQDAGKTWTKIISTAYGEAPYVEAVAISPDYAEDQTFALSVRGRGLFKTTDSGQTFTAIGDSRITLARMNSVPSAGRALQFSSNYADDNILYGFGSARTELYRSTDGGNTWETLAIARQQTPAPGTLTQAKLFLAIHRGRILKLLAILVVVLITYGAIEYLGAKGWMTSFLPEVQSWSQQVRRGVPLSLKGTIVALIILRLVFSLVNLDGKAYNADEVRGFYRISGYTRQEVLAEAFQGDILTVDQIQHYQTPSSARQLGDTMSALAGNPEHTPLYYLSARFWMQLWGTPVSARVISVLLGIVALPCAYWFGRELFRSAGAGWIAMGLIAISPYHLLLGQGAREYSLWTLAILLSNAALLRALRVASLQAWMIYALTVIVGLYSHLFFLFTLAAQGVYSLLFEWRRVRSHLLPMAVSGGVALLAFVPWLLVVLISIEDIDEKTQWVQSRPSSFVSIARASIANLGNTFFDLNDATRLENYADLLLLALTVLALYCLIRFTPARIWIFLLLPIVITGAVLVIPDLLYGGGRSLQARYLVPAFLSTEMAVAYFLGNGIAFAKRAWERIAWKLVFSGLIAAGVMSAVVIANTPGWDYLDQGETASATNLEMAPIINQAENPLIISDATHSFILALSHVVHDDVRFQLFQETPPEQWAAQIDLKAALNEYDTVFLYFPGNEFKTFFQETYGATLQAVYEDELFRVTIPG
ncbi:Xyloglucanase Xgh74A [Halomicronema hongdechloris C2206]|uniref:Xyloglucanase Xgh74A n=1 Tax=Halomicronema hongdechloris C2206 TaxID=1641165 RepID=A0A1Z3HT32_9CYAN|nr:YCF48-related protein [Halomicronema hongdechloris]ASC73445.1 Xyloglucanase Xgh74A [Halomicronema hongdechloris C2206]